MFIFHILEYYVMNGLIIIIQVMSGREWCTLEEWLQCRRPLCPMLVRHEGRVETSSTANNGLRVCFASRRIGSSFLDDEDGTSQVIYNDGLLKGEIFLLFLSVIGVTVEVSDFYDPLYLFISQGCRILRDDV